MGGGCWRLVVGVGCSFGFYFGGFLIWLGLSFVGDRVDVEMGRVVEDVENGGWKGGIHSLLCLGCVYTE